VAVSKTSNKIKNEDLFSMQLWNSSQDDGSNGPQPAKQSLYIPN